MSLQSLVNNAAKSLKNNSPAVLTGLSVTGVVTTAYLTARAAYKAAQVLEEHEPIEDPKERLKRDFKVTWTLYIPPAVAGSVTIACILGSSKASANRTAAAVTAYSLTEKAFSEYKEKVIEQFNANKEEKIRASIAQDHVSKTKMPSEMLAVTAEDKAKIEAGLKNNEVVVLGSGRVRCFEDYTGRPFLSDMESLRKAENTINWKIVHENYASLSDFYDLVDLRHTQTSDLLGWSFEKPMELKFFAVVSEDGEPCLAFEYNPAPGPL